MGTTPPTDLSQYPGTAPSAVPVVEGHSCPTCHSPMRNGGICLCTPTVSSKSSDPQLSSVPKKKPRLKRKPHPTETAVTPSDPSKSSEDAVRPHESQLRRKLFKTDTTSDLEASAEPGPSRVAVDETSATSSFSVRASGSGRSAGKVAAAAATIGGRTRHLCSRCPKSFSSPGKLSQHMYSHTGERPFVCQHCSKAFSSKFKLVRHALIHSDLRQYICPLCERTFHRKDHLKNHAKVHNPVKSTYTCDRPGCGKEYSSLLNYRKHVAVHAAEDGSLECTMCGLKFLTKEEIIYHLKVHAGSRTVKTEEDRKYRCDWCNRSFFTGKDVRRHMVVHTGKRDFLCQYCPQRFGRKDHLVRHIKKSHNSTGKKTKTKRTEVKTKSVSSILAETGVMNPTELNIVKSNIEHLKQEEDKEVAYPIVTHTETKTSAPSELLSQPGTSMLQTDTSGIIFSSAPHPSEPSPPPAYPMVVPPPYDDMKPDSGFMSDDIKQEMLPEFVGIEHLPTLIMLSDTPQLQPHPSQFLRPDEPHQISRHIMNLTAPGTSSDSDLIITEFMNPPDEQSTVTDKTPLPRFNQAFHQQPP